MLCQFAIAQLNANTTKVFSSFKITSQAQDGEWYQVIGLKGNRPLILTKSGLEEAKINWTKAAKTSSINDRFVEILKIEEIDDPIAIVLDVQMKSSVPLEDAYAILSFLNHGEDGKTRPATKQATIPALTTESQNIRIRFDKSKVRDGEWKLHFYHRGVELFDQERADLKEADPVQSFRLQFGRRRLAVGKGDSKPAPFYMPVDPPDEILLPEIAGIYIVKVKVTISKQGRISDYSFVEEINPKLKDHLSASIDKWLFFPEIKQGKTVERTVVVPLQLK